jgi:hypothetical protein
MLRAVGVTARPVGFQPRPSPPPPRPVVEIVPDVTGRLRIPCRTREERRSGHWWTPAERQAIEVEIAAGRVQRIPRGRSAYKDGRKIFSPGTTYDFLIAMKRLREAAWEHEFLSCRSAAWRQVAAEQARGSLIVIVCAGGEVLPKGHT